MYHLNIDIEKDSNTPKSKLTAHQLEMFVRHRNSAWEMQFMYIDV